MGTRVIFLRHGQSTYNARGLYQGCCDDSVLTTAGRQTAAQTGAFLSGIQLDAVYTSPLQRAKETTERVLAAMPGTPPQARDSALLREADLPHWQRLPFQTVRDRFAEDYACWKRRPHQFFMEIIRKGIRQQHYPALELYDRLQGFWQEILPRHRHQTLLVVAHGGTIRAAIATALGIDPAHYHGIQQSNCALSVLYFPTGEQQSARLTAANLSAHLGWTLPQLSGRGLRLLLVPSVGDEDTGDLAALLAAEPIQFGLSNTGDRAQRTLQALVGDHPETVRLQMQGSELPVAWQQALKQERQSEELTTGLAIARPETIATFLGPAIGLGPAQSWRLPLQSGTLSAIHYPADGYPPLLQTLNLSRAIASRQLQPTRTAAA